MATMTYAEPVQTHSAPVSTKVSPTPSISEPPASRAIPADFRSSLAAWWASSGYRDARVAEDRLLRRLAYYQPTPPEPSRSWFSWGHAAPATSAPQHIPTDGLLATLRTVFIPTPDPALAPPRPDMLMDENSSISTSSSSSKTKHKHKHARALHCNHAEGLTDYINTLEFSSPATKDSKEAVVVVHGYAAALGFFFRNWDAVARAADSTGRRTFFLDWLGMGLSSRPNPSLLTAPTGSPLEARVARAEHFFLSSLEAWRAAEGIERMVLIGHSLGGYLSSAYALKYPERVSSLILVSPAGIPHGSLGDKAVPPPTTQPKPVTERASLDAAADAAESEMHDPAASEAEAKAAAHPQQSATRRGMTKLFLWGWEKGLSPFSILRGMGPWGPLMVGKYSSRRFASQSPDDVRDLHSYIYGTSVMRGSGEFCISHLLAPGAYARMPIVDRIAPLKVPVTFMYGDSDWMDVEGGWAAKQVLAKAGNKNVDVHVVKNAGHHLYLDNADDSNAIIEAAIRAAPKMDS
ncbi:uncharacterized protein CcaverHIS019_0505150 [Cutaneotrichosporon cavernicola]|uniref:AB hydrolase-1 domain-containing protein n=1 Tax=Cutaneotrichosporon cavernicola TaxID=279322 RepID=A0AA48L6L3_9TREE|nr:uncharacterized protein CcaverHIS019_0505150 [Cutaneotrichosporon cavernicola]BEI92887.1 hypothetical protein CcaverHIS019_0505150 [Cutaneotrichosporon cavernicola]